MRRIGALFLSTVAGAAALLASGCRNHMPHAFTWPASGDTVYSHPKPPEGGYYSNWDPYAISIELTPVEDVNPVRTQHYLIATVKDKNGKPLPNRRVEWMVSDGGIGDIVEVDESGWRASRGYKVDNKFAVSHTNNFKHRLDLGTADTSDDIELTAGQTWCVITSPVEGDSYVTAYAPGIYDTTKHKAFAVKHWYDVKWECPPPATNPTGTPHEFVTKVTKYSDGTGLAGYAVTYTITDGPAAAFEPGGQTSATVLTDSAGMAKITLRQAAPAEGTNNIDISIMRPENVACCKPAVQIATCRTSKTWVGPKIACDKRGPAAVLAGEQFEYTINVSNPSQVDATNVVVTDSLPEGLSMVSSNPPGSGSWNLGTVPAGGSKTVSLMVVANRTGRFENCAEVRADQGLQVRCCATTTASSPRLAIEKRCPTEVTVCDPIDYIVIVKNAGDGVAKNVQFSDNLPQGLVTTDGKTSLSANLGDLRPGEAKEIRFSAKAAQAGRYENRATANAEGGLTADATCTTNVIQPGLTVNKTIDRQEVYIGRPAVFTISVTNSGSVVARDTTLTDPIPSGWQFVEAGDGGQMSGNTVTWRLGNLNPGESKSVKLTLRPTAAGAAKNVASASAVCANAQADVAFGAVGVPAILLECVDDPDPIEVGGQVTYTIIVTNQGTADDRNIQIECTIPDGEEFISAGGATPGQNSGASVSFAPLPTLAPKARAEWKVTVKGTKVGDVRFKVTLKSSVTTSGVVEETESTHIY